MSDAEGDVPTALPPSEFDSFQFIVLRRPPSRPVLDDAAAELLQRQHLGHLEAMRATGHLKVAGPLTDQTDESWRGICIYQVESIEAARRLAELDPSVKAGQLAVDVMMWHTRKGAITFID